MGIFVPRFTNLGTFDLVGNKIFWVGNLGSNWEYFGTVGNSEKSWEFWELFGNFQRVNRYRKKGARYRYRYFAEIVAALPIPLLSWQVRSLPLPLLAIRYFSRGWRGYPTLPKILVTFYCVSARFRPFWKIYFLGKKMKNSWGKKWRRFYCIRWPKKSLLFSLLVAPLLASRYRYRYF